MGGAESEGRAKYPPSFCFVLSVQKKGNTIEEMGKKLAWGGRSRMECYQKTMNLRRVNNLCPHMIYHSKKWLVKS